MGSILGDQDCARKCHSYGIRREGAVEQCRNRGYWPKAGGIFGANYDYITKKCQCACKGGKTIDTKKSRWESKGWATCEFGGMLFLFLM